MKKIISLIFLFLLFSTSSFAINYKYPNPLSPVLGNGKIFVGNSGGVATAVSLSGDATITSAGLVTIIGSSGTETVQGNLIVDTTSSKAFLIRKDGDSQDFFDIDTSREQVLISRDGNFLRDYTVDGVSSFNPGLSMADSGAPIRFTSAVSADATASAAQYHFLRSRGTLLAPTADKIGDRVMGIFNYGHDGTDYYPVSSIISTVEGTVSSNNVSGRVTIATTRPNGTGTTEGVRVENNQNLIQTNGITVAAIPSQGTVINCSIIISGTTLSIQGSGTTNNGGGSTLNAAFPANPCIIGLEGNTPGISNVAKFFNNVSISFGSTSDTDNNLFAITNAAWGNVLSFKIGVMADPTAGGTNNKFVISRKLFKQTGSAASGICQLGDTDCDGDDIMILSSGLTLANWTNQPITQVGWFKGSYATTNGGIWTFTAPIGTGFNKNYTKEILTFPLGQNGAAAGNHLLANGGTAPAITGDIATYTENENGVYTVSYYGNGDAGTDGSGSVTSLLSIPISTSSSMNTATTIGGGQVQSAGVGDYYAWIIAAANATSVTPTVPVVSAGLLTNTTRALQHADFTNGGRIIELTITYPTL